ncbi:MULTISPECIES: YkuS family protein [Clostridium]|uniref:YkuS family protein n=1 Tax=Clostridium senegalense TaxID=1465809 RepID=A0A6M0H0D8_9CLOT|nr:MULTISPECIES: YkuS family protein [Clostridium]NEU03967.1 YkuS family protein [Clostridium senegalense]
MKKVAVQKGLNPVKSFLNQEGYTVREFDGTKENTSKFLNKFDAVIVTGENENFMGIEDTEVKAQMINADGMTPQEIKNQLDNN